MWVRKRQRGFTLVELLIVVAILGLIAAVLIPNVLDALDRARQKRAMTDMRGIGTAWTTWLTDQIGVASAGAGKTFGRQGQVEIGFVDLQANLQPGGSHSYITELPQYDPWSSPYRFFIAGRAGSPQRLTICSAGSDGEFYECDRDGLEVGPFPAWEREQDIVWSDGGFVRWPEGLGG